MVTGADITNVKQEDVDRVLADILMEALLRYLMELHASKRGHSSSRGRNFTTGKIELPFLKCHHYHQPAAEDIQKLRAV